MRSASRRPPRARAGAGLLALALLVAAAGCTITRVYRGSPLRAVPEAELVPGATTKEEVLRVFGPPDGLARQLDGDVFVYRYERVNTNTLRIEEPVVTGVQLFTYTRSFEKHDSLVVLFGPQGVLREYGYAEGTGELDGL